MTSTVYTSFFGRIREGVEAFASRSPSRFAILIFAGLIGIFTALLAAPFSAADGHWTNFADALFTASSMVPPFRLRAIRWTKISESMVVWKMDPAASSSARNS